MTETPTEPPAPFPFATIEDLIDRWPSFPEGEEALAGVLLEDASQYILDACPTAAQASANTRKRIVCAVVRRSMQVEASDPEMVGMESMQMSTGPFSQSFKPTNPHGDFYLTRQEKISLGHGRQVAFMINVGGGSVSAHQPWCDLMFNASICSCGVSP